MKESLSFLGGEQLTIQGPRADKITISGGPNTYANIEVPPRAIVTLSDLFFANSYTIIYAFINNEGTLILDHSVISNNKTVAGATSYGGGISNEGQLTVRDNSIISSNSTIGDVTSEGGGIFNEGTLTVSNSTISNNTAGSSNSSSSSFGGGIDSTQGTVTITNSTFSGNKAISSKGNSQGGGIDNDGQLTVANSTFSHNTADSSSDNSFGGGITIAQTGIVTVTNSTFLQNIASSQQSGQGGGIDNDGQLTVVNSTLSHNMASGGNDAGGGGISFFGNKDSFTLIQFCTIYGNASSAGGGVWIDPKGASSSHLTISSSLIITNHAPDGLDISGTLTSGGYNRLTSTTGVKGLSTTDGIIHNPGLDTTLGSNGGPTQTLALRQGSPAIDVVPLQACSITLNDAVSGQKEPITTDQRGDPRPDDTEQNCDIGAYESVY